jgi:hypothetical protein
LPRLAAASDLPLPRSGADVAAPGLRHFEYSRGVPVARARIGYDAEWMCICKY